MPRRFSGVFFRFDISSISALFQIYSYLYKQNWDYLDILRHPQIYSESGHIIVKKTDFQKMNLPEKLYINEDQNN